MFSTRALFLLSLPLAVQGALKARCGNCWCAPGNGTCPTNETGIVDSFDTATFSVLSTFVLTNDPSFLKLQASDGSACYPFTDTVGVVSNMPQTQLPPCVVPNSSATSVCAYKYNPANTTCADRQYEVMTYDSAAKAAADGAVVTHTSGKSKIAGEQR